MICPNCGKDNFHRLDYDAIDDTGQCKGIDGCKYSESTNYVRGWNAGRKAAQNMDKIYDYIEDDFVCVYCRHGEKSNDTHPCGTCQGFHHFEGRKLRQ